MTSSYRNLELTLLTLALSCSIFEQLYGCMWSKNRDGFYFTANGNNKAVNMQCSGKNRAAKNLLARVENNVFTGKLSDELQRPTTLSRMAGRGIKGLFYFK